MSAVPEPQSVDYRPAVDETVAGRGARTPRRGLEFGLFGLALALQITAILLRLSGSGFTEVVVSNWFALTSYLTGLCGVFVRYAGWDRRKRDPRNHTYFMLASPLAGIAMVAMVGTDPASGFANTAVLVPGLIGSSLAWGWAHNSRMAGRTAFVEATETARTIFWVWTSLAMLNVIQWISQRVGGQPYVVPDLLYSLVSVGAFLVLVSTGYTQYVRAQESLQRIERRQARESGEPVAGT